MIPKAIGNLVFQSGYEEVIRKDVRTIIERSVSPPSALAGACNGLPDGKILTISMGKPSCSGDSSPDVTAALVRKITPKWNKTFLDWGMPLRIVENPGSGSAQADITLDVSACIQDEAFESLVYEAMLKTMGLTCAPNTHDLVPSLRRAISEHGSNPLYELMNYRSGDWRPAACGAPYLLSGIDVGALQLVCGAEVEVDEISKEFIDQLKTKYGNNIIGHFLGAFLADLSRRVVELLLIRGLNLQDRQWLIKLVGEVVSLSVQISVMASFGGYTVAGGALAAGAGFCYGTLGELLLPESFRAVLTTAGPVNVSLALIDYFAGTGNWVEIIGSYAGHVAGQLLLACGEAGLEHFLPETDPVKREMLAKGGFSIWEVFGSTACTEPLAHENLGKYLPECVLALHRGNKLLADLVNKYFNLMGLRQYIYRADHKLAERIVVDAAKQVGDLAAVMTRDHPLQPPSELTSEELLSRLSGGGKHFSFNCQVKEPRPDLWNDLLDALADHDFLHEEIETLDFRGLRIQTESGDMECPYAQGGGNWPASFNHLTVLALDAMPAMFEDERGVLMQLITDNLPRLEALRLTVPAEASDGEAGVPPHKLSSILEGQRNLTSLVADVYTDQVTAEGEESVRDGLISLYTTIANSETLQTVDLRTTSAMNLPPEATGRLINILSSNYLLYEFKPLQDDNGRIKVIMQRNRRLHTMLLEAAANPSKADAILQGIADPGMREWAKRRVVDVANRPSDLPSIIPDDATELSEVVVDQGDRFNDVVIEMPKIPDISSSSDTA
jgi:hypothetical protein